MTWLGLSALVHRLREARPPEAGELRVRAAQLALDVHGKPAEQARHVSHADAGEAIGADRLPLVVPVRGFLRRQPYGPGGSLRRLTYVAGHQARRWVAPRDVRVVVS